jgi:hypothetical protein
VGSRDDSLDPTTIYDRQLLLFGAKREAMLELWEVQRYGTDSFGDANHVSLFGMPPADWFVRGIRVLGRTAVECTGDALAGAIARDVADLAASARPTSDTLVIDPFAGSGNTLFWLQRRLLGSQGLGLELDPGVYALTKRNLASLGVPVEVVNIDCAAGLAAVAEPVDGLVVVFVAPPWGAALDPDGSLDLRQTKPPVTEVVDLLIRCFPHTLLLVAVQIYEKVEPASLSELRGRFDWSDHHVYDLSKAGQNHGVMLGTRRWHP